MGYKKINLIARNPFFSLSHIKLSEFTLSSFILRTNYNSYVWLKFRSERDFAEILDSNCTRISKVVHMSFWFGSAEGQLEVFLFLLHMSRYFPVA
jgi:hypothetical protein